MRGLIHSFKAAFRFRGYKPKQVRLLSALLWAAQFDRRQRRLLGGLLDGVIYLSEKQAREMLLQQNAILMERLARVGIPAKKLIYVSVHDAGSSSPVMLNLLRDEANLLHRGCRIIDGRSTLELVKAMNEIGEGALIYVDDFIGSGTQFCTEHKFLSQNYVGSFSEFLLAPCICEEAFKELDDRGVQPFAGHKHLISERPLRAECNRFSAAERQQLADICKKIDKFGLGYKGMATSVVLYRNAPNTVPVVLRGNVGQKPYFGILPRYSDLPVRSAPVQG